MHANNVHVLRHVPLNNFNCNFQRDTLLNIHIAHNRDFNNFFIFVGGKMPSENAILIYLFYIIYKLIISKICLIERALSKSNGFNYIHCYFRCLFILGMFNIFL